MNTLPMAAWAALRPDLPVDDVEGLAPNVWRVRRDVVKLFPGTDLARFRRIVRAHRQAGRIFREQSDLKAQRLLGFAEDERALLLDFVPGQSGRRALQTGTSPDRIMMQAGAWLHRFHDARDTSLGRFDPLGALERLPMAPECAEAAGYAAAHQALRAAAETLQGRTVRRAVLHGDMTLANLLFDGDRITGIDFENLAQHPVGRDVGEIWADLVLYLPELPGEPGLMPGAWRRSFSRHCKGLEQDVAEFYTRHRLLKAWAAIPAQMQDRGPVRAQHLARLLALQTRGAFAPPQSTG
ncbi:phosphotransferase [Phaeobacter sp. J2-8]|uniref:phosphotransferase n=1 Tax=Phaeobacter sp. J2-8 TaxID=2931394 RepID=UPI001FD47BC4|nr:phosphotransferase [Phaeobacter sp. J2-8]MCJ7871795.1 phosphotransferase [Phaeobacter sp. J2-8]